MADQRVRFRGKSLDRVRLVRYKVRANPSPFETERLTVVCGPGKQTALSRAGRRAECAEWPIENGTSIVTTWQKA